MTHSLLSQPLKMREVRTPNACISMHTELHDSQAIGSGTILLADKTMVPGFLHTVCLVVVVAVFLVLVVEASWAKSVPRSPELKEQIGCSGRSLIEPRISPR